MSTTKTLVGAPEMCPTHRQPEPCVFCENDPAIRRYGDAGTIPGAVEGFVTQTTTWPVGGENGVSWTVGTVPPFQGGSLPPAVLPFSPSVPDAATAAAPPANGPPTHADAVALANALNNLVTAMLAQTKAIEANTAAQTAAKAYGEGPYGAGPYGGGGGGETTIS